MDEITKETEEYLKISKNNANELVTIVSTFFYTMGKGFEDLSEEEKKNAMYLVSIAYTRGYQRGLREAKEN